MPFTTLEPEEKVMIINVTIGRLLSSRFRDFLKTEKFKGKKIEWIESSGWIEREFTIKGEADVIREIHMRICEWERYLNRDSSS
jgi:hypothetical protein